MSESIEMILGDNLSSQKILIVKEIQSNQSNKNGNPLIDLVKGDIIELKNDGIYFTRKIDLRQNGNLFKNVFESIKSQNKPH